jgi:hypothetical protein
MTCLLPPAIGSAVLSAPGLPNLVLSAAQGWSLETLQIGFPEVRPVVRSRALADGVFDDTRFLGQRVVSMTLRMATPTATQAAIDTIMPFMSPRSRPTLTYALAGSPSDLRAITLRGADAPIVIDGPSYQVIVCSWVSVDSFVRGASEECITLTSGDEVGRSYDLTFNRVYGTTGSTGSATVINSGNAPSHWTAVLTASTTDPVVRINGVSMSFDRNGGVTLAGAQTVTVDTKARTVLFDNDPATPAYNRVNFTDWIWDDLLIQPGANLIEYILDPGDSSSLTLCYYDTWF